MTAPAKPINLVIAEHAPRLMQLPGVVAVAEGALPNGRPCVRIWLTGLDEAARARFPKTLEGYDVLLEESGPIRAMGDSAR